MSSNATTPTPDQLASLGLTPAPAQPFTYVFDPTAASALVPNLGMNLAAAADASGGKGGGGNFDDTFNKVSAAAGVGLAVLAAAVPGPGTIVAGVGGAIIGGIKLASALSPKSSPPPSATPPTCCASHACRPDQWSYVQMCARSNGADFPAVPYDWMTGWLDGDSSTSGNAVNVPGLIPYPPTGDANGPNGYIRFTPNPKNHAPVGPNMNAGGLPNFQDYYLTIFETWWQSWCDGCTDPSHWAQTHSPAVLLAEALVAWNNKWANYDGAWAILTINVKRGTPSKVGGTGEFASLGILQKLANAFTAASGQELADPSPIAYSLHFLAPDAPQGHVTAIQLKVRAPSKAGAAQEASDAKASASGIGGELASVENDPTPVLGALAVAGAIVLAFLFL